MSVPPRAILSSLALVAVIVGTSLAAMTGVHSLTRVAGLALLVYILLEAPRVGRGGRLMLMAAAVAAGVAALTLPGWGPLGRALDEAASLAGLFTALGFLREAAVTSPLIQDCGDLMVRQPPGRRYLVLSLGSHLVSLVLNFGVLSLLGAMVVRGNTAEAAGGDECIVAIRRQRMMTALLRGFSVMMVWSPLSVSFAVTQSVVHGVPWGQLLPLQLGLAAIQLALGWLLDRRSFPPVAVVALGPTNWRPLGRLALLIAAVVVASVAMAEALGVRLIMGAVLVVPGSALVWLAWQHNAQGPAGAVANAAGLLTRRLGETLPAFRNEVFMLSGAMFLGTVVTAFISPAATAHVIAVLGLPPLVLTILLAWSVVLLAQIGLSQIVTVTLLGGALAEIHGLGVNPLVLASGLMGAWALSACSTPVGAAILTIARLSGVPMRVVARDWNGRYVILGALALAGWLAVLHLCLGPSLGG